MQRCFLAAEAGEPEGAALRTARQAAERLAWADPLLRAHEGRAAQLVLDSARTTIGRAVGDPDAHVLFVPGRDAALTLAAASTGEEGPLVVSAADRRSVLRTAANRARSTAKPPVPVDSLGRIDLDRYLKDLRTATAAAVQVGNPEVATSQPVDAIHHACIDLGIPLVVDATMAAGRAPLPTAWDVLVLDGRSWGGGNDVSIVVRRRTTEWRPTDIETALRDGLGVPACAAAALTLESALPETAELFSTLRGLTDRLRAGLQGMTDVVVHGDPVQRLPHIVGFSALYIDAEALLLELDRLGLSVASGSACAVDDNRPSHVLAAMGALTSGNVRVTLPRAASLRCVERLLEALPPLLQRMRAEAGV